MKCYICFNKGVDRDAIAICIVCGMGVCNEHLVREEQPIKDVIDWGLGEEIHKYPRTLPRILCVDCYGALVVQRKPH